MCHLTLRNDILEFREKLPIGSPCSKYGQSVTPTLTVTQSSWAFTQRESLTGVVWHLPCCSTGFQDLLTSHTLCMSFSYSTSKSGRRKTFQVNKLLGGQSHVLHLRGRTIQIICSWNASQMPVLTDTGLTSWLYGFGHITHSPDKQLPLQAAPWGCDSMACLPACYRKPVLQQEDEQSCGNLSP